MMKNRVVPQGKAEKSFKGDPFFGKSEAKAGKSGINPKSRNITKTKYENEKKFNKTNIKKGKFQPKTRNLDRVDKFKKLDTELAEPKNNCKEIMLYKGGEKKFDKKKWRLQKYSKKYKLEQWEEKRKKSVLKEYYQQIKDETPKVDINKIYEQYDSDNETENENNLNTDQNEISVAQSPKNFVQNPNYRPNYVQNPNFKPKINTKQKVKLELERMKEEKLRKKEEVLKKKQEKEEALKVYKQKKQEKQRQLNKKTKRGQPVMKGRMEMLLEKIQNN